MTTVQDDYINPIADGTLNRHYASCCTTDLDKGMENWQTRMHEISGRHCAHLTKSLLWIGSEVSQIPMFSGFSHVTEFLTKYQVQVPSSQIFQALDVALPAIPARWWAEHKKSIATWETCHRLLMIRVGEKLDGIECQYDGQTDPRLHIELYTKKWQHRSPNEWVHLFVHTLDISSRNWYTETELHRGTENWPLLVDGFELTFNFESECPKIDNALWSIRARVFEADPLPMNSYQDWVA